MRFVAIGGMTEASFVVADERVVTFSSFLMYKTSPKRQGMYLKRLRWDIKPDNYLFCRPPLLRPVGIPVYTSMYEPTEVFWEFRPTMRAHIISQSIWVPTVLIRSAPLWPHKSTHIWEYVLVQHCRRSTSIDEYSYCMHIWPISDY